MISICAGETTLGHVMMWVVIIALIGVVFCGLQNTQPSFTRRTAAPNCIPGTCNPVNFPVLKPSDWTQGHVIGIRIDEKGLDPRL
jgi:hypothetical protein